MSAIECKDRDIMKKILCVILTAVFLLSAVSCANVTENETTMPDTQSAGNTTDVTNDVQDDGVFRIGGADIRKFTVIRAEKASDGIISLAVGVRGRLSELFGVEFELKTDWLDEGENPSEHEILVGETNREKPEGSGARCGVSGGRLYFYGDDEADTAAAFDVFISKLLSDSVSGELAEGTKEQINYTYEKYYTDANGSGSAEYMTNENFLWGVNGHNRAYAAYPQALLSEQIRTAALLGCKLYRFNFNPRTEDDFSYMDSVVKYCEKYGMQLMLVLDDMSGEPDAIYDRCVKIAEAYKGRIKYFQLFNETDVYAMYKSDGGLYAGGDGSSIAHYNPERVTETTEKMLSASRAFKDTDADCRLVINFAWLHTALLKAYADAGVEWDVTGIDWYSDMEGASSISTIVNTVDRLFPDKEIIICECNIWAHNEYTEEQQADYLTKFSDKVYKLAGRKDNFIGMIVYELLDEMNLQSGAYSGEAHFGLVNCSSRGKIGDVKEAYRALRYMWCGGEISFRTVRID